MASRPPSRIVVTGAGRGLGLELVRQWLVRGNRVFALARHPETSEGLASLQERFGEQLSLVACDIRDDASVARAQASVAGAVDALEIVVNNAGVYGQHGGSIHDLDLDEVREVFEVNAIGTLRVSRAFLPLLRRGRRPRLVHMTSLMGSIGDNGSGGSYAYRISKAALNMAARNLAHDLQDEIVSVVLHPGWVRTDMGGPNAPLEVEDSVADLVSTIKGLDLEHSGGFYSYRGRALPW